MNLAGLGGLASGLTQGYDNGLNIQAQRQKMMEAQRQNAARAALANAQMAPQGQPGQAPGGAPQQPLTAAAMPGAQPMPPGVSSQPAAPQGGAPGGVAPMGGPPPQQGAPMGAPPPGPGGAPPGGPPMGGGAPPGGPPPQGGGAPAPQQPLSFANETKQSLMAMYQNVAKANPKLDPITASYAVDRQIEQMKGIEPDTKLYMTAQMDELRIKAEGERAAQKAQDAVELAEVKGKMIADLAKSNGQLKDALQRLKNLGAEDVANTRAGATLGAASTRAGATLGAAGIRAGAEEAAATTRAGATTGAAGIHADASRSVAETSRKARENAAAIANGKPAPYPALGQGGGSAAPVKVKTPAEAHALKPGTTYTTPDGQTYTR